MRAIQMDKQGSPDVLHVVDIERPTPREGQLLLKVEAAAVNYSDVVRRRGDPYPDPTPLPFVPGAEIAGTIMDVGPGVTGFVVGDRVFGVAGNADGGYSELALMYAANAIPLATDVDPATAAGTTVVGLTAALLLTEVAALQHGEAVFVPAAGGGVGLYAVQIARLLGARVIAGASTEEKRRIAREHGAHEAVDYSREGWTDEVRALTDGRGVDVALEMISPAHLTETLAITAAFGRVVVYGAVAGQDTAMAPATIRSVLYDPADGQSIRGFNLGTWFARRPERVAATLQQLFGWIAAGDLHRIAVTRFPLAAAAEAHRALESGTTTGKVVLIP